MIDPAATSAMCRQPFAGANRALRTLCTIGLVTLLLLPGQAGAARRATATQPTAVTQGRLPLAFAPNVGQLDPAVRFQLAIPGGAWFFTPGAVVLAIDDRQPPNGGGGLPASSTVQLQFVGANVAPQVAASDRLPGTLNMLRGSDTQAWRTGIPTYAGIVYRQLYPGIDLHYAGLDGQLKGSYLLAPGADPARIRWRYQGAEDDPPPAGRYAPHRGFGYLWASNAEVRAQLGWAIAPEQGETGGYRRFQRGFLLYRPAADRFFVVSDDGAIRDLPRR